MGTGLPEEAVQAHYEKAKQSWAELMSDAQRKGHCCMLFTDMWTCRIVVRRRSIHRCNYTRVHNTWRTLPRESLQEPNYNVVVRRIGTNI
jgi:hypothetical protein